MKIQNKTFGAFILLLLFFIITGYTGTLNAEPKSASAISIANVTANLGDSIQVAVNTTDLTNISAITLIIQFNPDVLTWKGVDSMASALSPDFFLTNLVGNTIRIAWFSLSPANFTNGKLFNLKFDYKGGTSPLSFTSEQCAFSNNTGQTVAVNYVNGSVSPLVQTPPSAPLLASPANGSTGVVLNPRLEWNRVESAISYNLQVSTDTNFNSIVINQTGIVDTFFNASGLVSGTRYFWRVNSYNSRGTSDFSTVWSFVTLPSYIISTRVNPPEGGTATGGGVFLQGVTDTVKASPFTGYHFVNWTDGNGIVSTDSIYIFTVSSNRILTANFELDNFVITVNNNPAIGGTTTGSGTYQYGQSDTLKAFPNQGYTFTNWKEGSTVISTSPIYVFTVDRARTITANFTPNNYTITTLSSPVNGGLTAGGGTYYHGQIDTVKALPNPGYIFIYWTEGNNIVSSNLNYVFTVDRPRTLTANFNVNNFTVTTASNPPNGGTTRGGGNFYFGQTDTIAATPNTGYRFVNWTEGANVISTDSLFVFAVTSHRVLTANFTLKDYNITLNKNPQEGGTVTGGGNFLHGQVDTVRAAANTGYAFVNWTEGANVVSTNPEIIFTVTSSRTLTANFSLNSYIIAASANPQNGGVITGSGTFNHGKVDTLKASANPGFTFVNWKEGANVVSTDSVYIFTVTGARTLTANFTLNGYIITTNSNPPAGGTTTGGGGYFYGHVDTVNATANAGYTFVNWTEGANVISTDPVYIFTIDRSRTLTANFSLNSYAITINSNPQIGGTASGGGTYFYGTSDTVKAVSNTGYHFVNWTEGANVVSSDSVYIFTVTDTRTLTANFAINTYIIATVINPQNGGTVSGAGVYQHGQIDTLKAVPNTGFHFVNWTEGGNVVSSDTVFFFTVTGARTITANFAINSYVITLNSNPANGGSTTGAGNYFYGQIDTVKAVSNTGYTFVNWTEGGTAVSTSPVYVFTVSGARTLTANFSLNSYTISTIVNPASGGTATGGGIYAHGSVDTVKARANTGYHFVNWTEGTNIVSTDSVYIFTVIAPRNLTANFALNGYVITTLSNPQAGGTTTGGGNYLHGQVDTVKAVASQGYTFQNWTEGANIVSTSPEYIFVVTGPRILTANFKINSYVITTSSIPLNGGTTSGGGTYNYGQSDTVKAVPKQGYMFVNWTENGNVVSANPVYVFTVNSARNLVANFCSIIVTAPNGGELWVAGNTHSITWKSDNVANLKIEYTTDNGNSWQLVAPSVPAVTGIFDWLIPNTPSTACKVKLSDVSIPSSFDLSDQTFAISNVQNVPTFYLSNTIGGAGDSLIITLSAKNLVNTGAITLNIQFDTSKVAFGRILNLESRINSAIVGSTNGNIMILWDGIPAVNYPDNKLMDLQFFYKGSEYKTPVTFNLKNCEITDAAGGKFQVSYINGGIIPGVNISGTLVYANQAATPLEGVKVYLKNPVNIVDSTTTAANGTFVFKGKGTGDYRFSFNCDKPWGGVNSTDALLIRRFLSYTVAFDSLQIKSADVNKSGSINSTDALLIRRRVAFIDTSFAVGNWVFEDPTLTVGTLPVDKTIKCLATGDVNASYSFGTAKTAGGVKLSFNNHSMIKNTSVDLPVTLTSGVELGAVTMFIEYDPTVLQIDGVAGPFNDMSYSVSNGKVAISWADVNPIAVSKNGAFINLKGNLLDAKKAIDLTLTSGCELAEANGSVVKENLFNTQTVELNIPKQFELKANYPNPFNPSTTIVYSIPEDMPVSLVIYDVLGREVKTLINQEVKAGTYNITWLGEDNHGKKVTSGMYIYKLNGKKESSVKKMIMLK